MFHRLEFRVHCHATEEEDRVLLALANLIGDIEPERKRAAGFHGNPIIIFTATLGDKRAIDAFWKRLKDSGELIPLLGDIDRLIDADGSLHLRFDKQEAYRGRLKVVGHDDVVSMRGKVAAYPARRERAIEVARGYLQEV